jgi:integrase
VTKKRRANGLGGIRWNAARNRYEATVTVESIPVERDANGRVTRWRQVRRTVTGNDQRQVLDRLEALRRTVELGPGLPAEMTVARFLEHWTADVLPLADLSPTTADGYTRIVRLYIVPTIGRVRLDQLAPSHVRAMLTRLREQGLAPNTQRLARSVLRRALRTAEADGLVTRNVAALVDGVRVAGGEGRTLTPDQARALLRAADGAEFGALVNLLLSCGLRKGEALGLSWRDVDLDATPATLTVRRALKKDGRGGLYVDEPKTARSRRTVHLPAPLVDVLRRHRADQAEQRLAFGAGWGGRWAGLDLVFTSSVGTPLDPDRTNREVQRLAAMAGLGAWTPHELRHSAASLLLAQGVDLKVVSEMLGHSSIRVTADVYGHLLDPARTEAADAMTDALWGAS